MDVQARRVNPRDLTALHRLRLQRERRARADLCALLEARQEAARLKEAADRQREAAVTTRRDGEAALYARLVADGPINAATLEGRRAPLGRWAEQEANATFKADASAAGLMEADDQVLAGQRRHALRARATRKWNRVSERVMSARSRHTDLMDELESEEDSLARFGGRA